MVVFGLACLGFWGSWVSSCVGLVSFFAMGVPHLRVVVVGSFFLVVVYSPPA